MNRELGLKVRGGRWSIAPRLAGLWQIVRSIIFREAQSESHTQTLPHRRYYRPDNLGVLSDREWQALRVRRDRLSRGVGSFSIRAAREEGRRF